MARCWRYLSLPSCPPASGSPIGPSMLLASLTIRAPGAGLACLRPSSSMAAAFTATASCSPVPEPTLCQLPAHQLPSLCRLGAARHSPGLQITTPVRRACIPIATLPSRCPCREVYEGVTGMKPLVDVCVCLPRFSEWHMIGRSAVQ